jgi:hypothetical protein
MEKAVLAGCPRIIRMTGRKPGRTGVPIPGIPPNRTSVLPRVATVEIPSGTTTSDVAEGGSTYRGA